MSTLSETCLPNRMRIARAILRPAFRLMGGICVLDAKNVPASGPALICPNHISDCDPFAILATCPRDDVFLVAKQEFFEMRPVRILLEAFGTMPIRRDSADRAAIRQAVEILRGGAVLVLFPEGRLAESGNLGTIQPGAAMIALRANTPIIPVGLTRTNQILPYGHIIPNRSRLPARVQYGVPLEPSMGGDTGRKAIDDLTKRIEAEIRRLTGQERTE